MWVMPCISCTNRQTDRQTDTQMDRQAHRNSHTLFAPLRSSASLTRLGIGPWTAPHRLPKPSASTTVGGALPFHSCRLTHTHRHEHMNTHTNTHTRTQTRARTPPPLSVSLSLCLSVCGGAGRTDARVRAAADDADGHQSPRRCSAQRARGQLPPTHDGAIVLGWLLSTLVCFSCCCHVLAPQMMSRVWNSSPPPISSLNHHHHCCCCCCCCCAVCRCFHRISHGKTLTLKRWRVRYNREMRFKHASWFAHNLTTSAVSCCWC